jgi:hypothetical protein
VLHPQLFEEKRIHIRLALDGGAQTFANAVARTEADEQQDRLLGGGGCTFAHLATLHWQICFSGSTS